ncbi:MAG: hypothetical protein KGN79_13905 [Acidobacteriota bacterium]|nr:hypothetical protein [Acidobacteriota bacterium]
MARRIWIIGLTFALFFYGAFSLVIIFALISRRHLNWTGWSMFVGNGYILWITYWYLRQKIAEKDKS